MASRMGLDLLYNRSFESSVPLTVDRDGMRSFLLTDDISDKV